MQSSFDPAKSGKRKKNVPYHDVFETFSLFWIFDYFPSYLSHCIKAF